MVGVVLSVSPLRVTFVPVLKSRTPLLFPSAREPVSVKTAADWKKNPLPLRVAVEPVMLPWAPISLDPESVFPSVGCCGSRR